MIHLRNNNFTPEGMRKMMDKKGKEAVKATVANCGSERFACGDSCSV
jgi:hypothetical protein